MFKGPFKNKNTYGKPLTYLKGDIVSYQGKIYECVTETQKSPLQVPDRWSYTDVTTNFISSVPPLKPKSGQKWISGSGIEYVWFEDDNSSQWIQT